MEAHVERPTIAARSSSALDRIERFYLKVLRAALLLVATILILCATGWAVVNLLKIARSPESVVETPSIVTPSDIISADTARSKPSSAANSRSDALRNQRAFYDNFIKRYFALYQAKYQTHLRADDKKVSLGEFDDLTIASAARLDAVRSGELDFATDKKDLETFLPVITNVSSSPATVKKLAQYRVAKKQAVTNTVQRTRTETRRGWDSYSTACDAWYESPIGCAVTRRVEVPYSERVSVMRYPDGISSPNEVLKSYQDKYFNLLAERREANASKADGERQDILSGKVSGWAGLSQAVMIVGAFLILMFFFLLVAIERHQRRLTATLG